MINFFIFSAAVFTSGFVCCLATTLLMSALAAGREDREKARLDNTERDERAFAE